MPLTSPKVKSTNKSNDSNVEIVKNGLNSLHEFIKKNGELDLAKLFTKSKIYEVNSILSYPQKSNSNTKIQSKNFLSLIREIIPSDNNQPNDIHEKTLEFFKFDETVKKGLRIKFNKDKTTNQEKINKIIKLQEKIGSLSLNETFDFVYLYFSVQINDITCLNRLKEFRDYLSIKKISFLNPENYELLENKQNPNQNLKLSNLGALANKEWPAIKEAILNDLVPPQTDSLSSVSNPSSSNAVLNANINANDSINNSSDSTDNSESLTPSIDTQLVINEQAQNQEIAQIKIEKEALEEKYHSLEDLREKLEVQITALKTQLENNEAALQHESESNTKQIENLQKNITAQNKELEDLRKNYETTLENLKTSRTEFLTTQEAKIELENKFSKIEAKIKTLDAHIIKLTKEAEEKDSELLTAHNNLKDKLSAHDLITKQLADLQTQHTRLQSSLKEQEAKFTKNLESKNDSNNLLHQHTSKLNDEITFTKNKLYDTEKKLIDASQKSYELVSTIKILQSEKIELEVQKETTIRENKDIEAQLNKQKEKYQTLLSNYEKLKSESENIGKNLTSTTQKLKEQTELTTQLQLQIEEKTILSKIQHDKIAKTHKIQEETNNKLQEAHKQLATIKLQLKTAQETEEATAKKLNIIESRVQELELQLKQQEELKIKIGQVTNINTELSQNLSFEKAQKETVSESFESITKEVASFISQADKLLFNADTSDFVSFKSPNDLSEEFKSFLKKIEVLNNKVAKNEQLQDELFNLKLTNVTVDGDNTNRLTEEIEILKNQIQALLEKNNSLKEQNDNLIADLNQGSIQIEDDSEPEYDESGFQFDTFDDSFDDDEIKAYKSFPEALEELAKAKNKLEQAQTELQQKINESNQLQRELESQKIDSNSEIDTLKKSLKATQEKILEINQEKEKLKETSQLEQQKLHQAEDKKNVLQTKLDKLIKTDSSNQEAITNLKSQLKDDNKVKSIQETKIHELEEKIENLTTQEEQKTSELGKLKKELNAQKNESNLEQEALKKQIETLKQSSKENLSTFRTEKENAVKKYEEKIKALTNKLNAQTNESNSEQKSLREEIETAKENVVKEYKEEIENLKETLQIEQEKFSQAEDKKNDLQAELDKLSTTDSSNQEVISELKAQLAELTKLGSEKEDLIQNLKDNIEKVTTHTQQKIEELEQLNADLTALNEKNSTTNKLKISKLEKKIEDSLSLQRKHEKSIQDQNTQLNTNKNDLESLRAKLNTADLQAQQFQQTIKTLETEKFNLDNKISELEQQNIELTKLPNQPSVNDDLIVELEHSKTIIEKKLIVVNQDLKNVTEKLGFTQDAYKKLNDNYAKLEEELSKEKIELNKLKTELNEDKKQLKTTQEKNKTQGELVMPTNDDLMTFEDPIPDENGGQIHPEVKFVNSNGFTSSGHSSDESSNPSPVPKGEDGDRFNFSQPSQPSLDSLFNSGGSSISDPISQSQRSSPLFQRRTQSTSNLSSLGLSSFDPLSNSHTEESSIINSEDNGTPLMPTQAQRKIESLLLNSEFRNQLETQLTNRLKKHFVKAFKTFISFSTIEIEITFSPNELDEFQSLAKNAVSKLLGNDTSIKEIKCALSETLSQEEEDLPSTAAKSFLNLFTLDRVSADITENYKECYKVIENTLLINQQNVLLKICAEQILSPEKMKAYEIDVKNQFSYHLNKIGVNPDEYEEKIKNTASKLVKEIFTLNNTFQAFKQTEIAFPNSSNKIEATRKLLAKHCDTQIQKLIADSFAHIYIDRILEKISTGEALSNEEIQKIPHELQYANSIYDFELGLKALFPNLNYLKDPAAFDRNNCFLTARSLLRIKALKPLISLSPEEFLQEITDCDGKTWLEKKLQLVSNQSISLKLDAKQQKNLDNKFHKLFSLLPLEDMAVTNKSDEELKNELKKLYRLKIEAINRLYKSFSEIDNELNKYPSLIKDVTAFTHYLNLKLTDASSEDKLRWKVTEDQTKILIAAIDMRLEHCTSKWNFGRPNDKLVEEIAQDILENATLITSQFSELNDIKKLIVDTFDVLNKLPNLFKDTLNKRQQWNSEIQQLYALTQKLKPSSQFSQEIEEREAIIETMLEKHNDSENRTNSDETNGISRVYLPNKCRVIPNSPEADLTNSYEHTITPIGFYKPDALEVNKPVSFAQTLASGDECKWSVTLRNDKSLAYHTQKKFFRRETSYIQEISFAQMIHSVNSFKNAKVCTLNFGNCSNDMKEKLYLFAHAYNELRHDANNLLKRPLITCQIKNPPNLDKSKIAKVKDEIKAMLNLGTEDIANTSEKLKDDTIRHQVIRARG